MFAEIPCKECGGTGRNGTIGGAPLICRPCGGTGRLIVEYLTTLDGRFFAG